MPTVNSFLASNQGFISLYFYLLETMTYIYCYKEEAREAYAGEKIFYRKVALA